MARMEMESRRLGNAARNSTIVRNKRSRGLRVFLALIAASGAWFGTDRTLGLAFAPDGSGTLATPTTSVANGSTGNTIVFTYTAATGGTNNGAITIVVPTGWSAPSTTGSNAGYTTSSTGTVSVASQTVTVSGLTLGSGATATITYGSKASSGPGATASSTAGAATWQAQEQSTSSGALTNLASSPGITVLSADGSGTMTSDTSYVAFASTGNTITFTYTAAAGGLSGGAVTLSVPCCAWSAPSTTGSAPGYTTSSTGTVSVASYTITVSGVTLSANGTFTIVYGSKASGGPGATAPSYGGGDRWSVQEKSSSGGTLTSLASSPQINVLSADGSGTMTSDTANVANGSTGNTITFTYQTGNGGTSNGTVTVVVPSGWSAPSTTGTDPGYTTTNQTQCNFTCVVSVSGQTITLSGLNPGLITFTLTYGSKASGGPGATAPTTAGAATWTTQEKSSSGGTLTNLASSPSINVLSADGSGTLTTGTSSVVHSSTGNTITFTYTGAAGGMSSGSVRLVVPSGWSAPSTTGTAPGYTTSSAGTVSVSGQTITVSGVTLNGGSTFTIVYGATSGGGSGASATSSTGAQTWQASGASTSSGIITNLASSPSINVT